MGAPLLPPSGAIRLRKAAMPKAYAAFYVFYGPKWAKKSRRRSTLPRSHPRSTIDAKELNFRVRDGIGCGLFANITGKIVELSDRF